MKDQNGARFGDYWVVVTRLGACTDEQDAREAFDELAGECSGGFTGGAGEAFAEAAEFEFFVGTGWVATQSFAFDV